MISLLSLTKYNDSDLYSARWLDDAYGINYEFNAVHTADGRPLARTEDCPAPVLSQEQIDSAQLNQHPAYELAAKGVAVRPDWLNRYTKAAELVEAGRVRLTSQRSALVDGDSDQYEITGNRCRCEWTKFNSEPCSHVISVRMARALKQPIQPLAPAEEAALNRADNRRAVDSNKTHAAGRGENIHERNRRQARCDGDGARQYWRMAYANGRATISPQIHHRATGD